MPGRSAQLTVSPTPAEFRETDLLRAAFRDVHGPALHGFAVLLMLGDGARAGSAAGAALAEGVERADELRHPERAAAWLRARILRRAPRTSPRDSITGPGRAALAELGVSATAAEALSGLGVRNRAALIASSIERFSMADVATILGRSVDDTHRVVNIARRRYLDAATPLMDDLAGEPAAGERPHGELAARVDTVARDAIGPSAGRRARAKR